MSRDLPEPQHEPVLVDAVLRLLAPAAGQIVLDGTVGLGGHAAAILPRLAPGGLYIGLDLDPLMLDEARRRLAAFGDAVRLVHANYADFAAVLDSLDVPLVDAMLLDLGVNSAQLADAARGFSFEQEGPLDMRFDRGAKRQALDLVNSLSEKELADLFYEFGQEGASRKIAKRICQVRHEGRITTTRGLAAAVESVFSSGRVRTVGKVHPATRVFQALRVAVNQELDSLERFMAHAAERLRPGGRLAAISFHSLEDGIVKRALRTQAALWQELTDRPVIAEGAERDRNPRSRSAKLRAAERLSAP